MNLVGKILTGFICLMCIVFASFVLAVYATTTNWKQRADSKPTAAAPEGGLKQQLEKSKEETEALKKKKLDLEAQDKMEKDRMDARMAELQTAAMDAIKKLKGAEETVSTLRAESREAVIAMTADQETLRNLRGVTEQLRKDIELARADRDKQFKEVVRLTDELNSAVNERKRLEDHNQTLAADLADARFINQFFHKDKISTTKEPPDGTRGLVVAVGTRNLVEISIGHDSGVAEGHTLYVVHQGDAGRTFVCKVKVTETSPDRAVCQVERPITRPIERGDLVLAKL